MYKEVAFDPVCMAQFEYYSLLKQHFGFEHGRYVSADIKAWAQEAMANVKASQLQPVKEKSIKYYLNKMVRERGSEEFQLAVDRKKIVADGWTNWWTQQNKYRAFTLTISENPQIPCIQIEQINDKHADWEVPRSISIAGNADEIVKTLLPSCFLSSEITIIDPYFKLADNKVLKKLIQELQIINVTKLKIVSTIIPDKPADNYNNYYKALNNNKISFSWIVAPDKFFHDRYFITDIGAIRSGNGFEEQAKKGAHADMLNLNIIGFDEAKRTLANLNEFLRKNPKSIIFQV